MDETLTRVMAATCLPHAPGVQGLPVDETVVVETPITGRGRAVSKVQQEVPR